MQESIDSLPDRNLDLKGQRFLNASDAVSQREFLTLGQGDGRYVLSNRLASLLAKNEPDVRAVRIGTYALRGLAAYHRYTIFEASDRNYVAWASDGASWLYSYGIQSRTQAQLAALAATLGTADAGYLVWVTDYEHVLRWSGTVWTFGPGDAGGGYVAYFLAAPNGNGWVLVNGTATTILKADGTTTAVTPYDVSTMMLPYLRR
jgi:hypothetical protein